MSEKTMDEQTMDEKNPTFAQELAACLDEREAVEGHLTADEIFAYLGGDEEEVDGDRIRQHLVGCSRCLGDLLAAAGLHSQSEDVPGVDFETAAAWRALRERLRAEDLERERDEARQRSAALWRAHRAARRWRLPMVAAAACLCMILGGLARRAHLELRALERPQLNALIEDVVVPTRRTRGAAGPARVEVPAGVAMVTLVFPLASDRSYPTHRVEIVADDGSTIWDVEGVLRVDAGTWNLGVPRGFLEAGHYRVRLLGLGALGEPEELGIYPFEIDFSDP